MMDNFRYCCLVGTIFANEQEIPGYAIDAIRERIWERFLVRYGAEFRILIFQNGVTVVEPLIMSLSCLPRHEGKNES